MVAYPGGWQAESLLEASLSAGSAPPWAVTRRDLGGALDRRVVISYRAATSGSVPRLRWTQTAGDGSEAMTMPD
jgi:hypothetical protein